MAEKSTVRKSPYKILVPLTIFIAFLGISLAIVATVIPEPPVVTPVPQKTIKSGDLPAFSSCAEIKNVLKEAGQRYYGVEEDVMFAPGSPVAQKMVPSREYSETNVQVLGVDEADIVKTDGTYIYSVSGNEVIISKAYPPNEATILSRITVEGGNPQEIFIHNDNVLIFGTRSVSYSKKSIPSEDEFYPYYGGSNTFVEIYDTSEKTKPVLKRSLDFEGNYQTSRKIKNYVYFVLDTYRYYYEGDDQPIVPMYREGKDKEFEPLCECVDVSIVRPVENYSYLTIVSIPMDNYYAPIQKEVLFGASQNVYASMENLYIANTKYDYDQPVILERFFGPVGERVEETSIYKFALDRGYIIFTARGAVPGHILNQFSMDEHKGYFRIATTVGQVARGVSKSANNVYVLDEKLIIVGGVEGLAIGEKIYSARFLGDKGYLVTFKKVDPFFTLDLSDPENPKAVGKLKIPGYSDYLHPYDENYIIGLGKETEAALSGDFAWYQGIKIAIFDVSDFANPKQLHKIEIGDRGTDSYALQDHKAFLFDKKRNLLVIPVLLAEIPEEKKGDEFKEANIYGTKTFQGAYVYRLTLDKGFELLGRITHAEEFKETEGYYYYSDPYNVKRSLYIEDYLYTISDKMIGINKLLGLEDEGRIRF